MGFGPLAQHAFRRLRKTWARGTEDIAVTLLGIGSRESFRKVGGKAIPELALGATWASQTPFIPPRFLKPSGKDSLEGQVSAELHRRGLPGLAAAPTVALPTDDSETGHQARSYRHFARTRSADGKAGPPPGLFHLTLTLQTPIEGPLCLGWGCHFGLGLFVPVETPMRQAIQ
jgi:CRISPR-associated protein Csb2